MSKDVSLDEINDFGNILLTEAGVLLTEGFGKTKSVSHKALENDLVTSVDRNSEKLIRELINEKYPDHSIYGEEEGETTSDSPYRWIIDPVDGTINFIKGIPIFSVSIALEKNKELLWGGVYNPIMNECYIGINGGGAYLNGKKIHVSTVETLKESILATGFPYNRYENPKKCIDLFSYIIYKARGMRRCGSASIDLCWVAEGRFEGYFEVGIKPYDIAAGLVILKEAGGKYGDFSNSQPYDLASGEIVSSNGTIFDEFLSEIKAFYDSIDVSKMVK